jgi:hypothetical protein
LDFGCKNPYTKIQNATKMHMDGTTRFLKIVLFHKLTLLDFDCGTNPFIKINYQAWMEQPTRSDKILETLLCYFMALGLLVLLLMQTPTMA